MINYKFSQGFRLLGTTNDIIICLETSLKANFQISLLMCQIDCIIQ